MPATKSPGNQHHRESIHYRAEYSQRRTRRPWLHTQVTAEQLTSSRPEYHWQTCRMCHSSDSARITADRDRGALTSASAYQRALTRQADNRLRSSRNPTRLESRTIIASLEMLGLASSAIYAKGAYLVNCSLEGGIPPGPRTASRSTDVTANVRTKK